MPPIVATIAAAVVAIGTETAIVTVIGVGGLQILGSVVGTVIVTGALSMATTYISRAFAPKASTPDAQAAPAVTPSDGQQTTRDPVSPRWKHYGRVKIGGAIVFYESKEGLFYVSVAQGQGEFDAIEEHWLNDLQVTVDDNGYVLEAKYQNSSRTYTFSYNLPTSYPASITTTSRVRIINHLGGEDQLSDATLNAAFPDAWTDAHRLRGVPWTLSVYADVSNSDFANVYRGGAPVYRCVARASKVLNGHTGEVSWSDNPAWVIYDYLTGDDGMRIPVGKINMESFRAAANICDEVLSLGGSLVEKRYRLWGSYQLNEEPLRVLERMLATCGGDFYTDNTGLICLKVAVWNEPTVCLDADKGHIIAYDMVRGPDMFSKVNTVKIVFTYPDNDYKETEGDPWIDLDAISEDGDRLEDKLELFMVPSHTQARRLAKIHYSKANPKWAGRIISNLYGIQTINEETVILNIPELEIYYGQFYIVDRQLADDGCTMTIDVISADKTAYSFSIEDEGTLPVIPESPNGNNDGSIQSPSGIRVVAGRPLGGGTTVVLYIIWDETISDSITHVARYRTGSDPFVEESVGALLNYDITANVVAGSTYDVGVKTIGSGGLTSPFSVSVSVEATVNNVAPGSCSGLTATFIGGGAVSVKWTTPISDEFVATKIYRGVTNVFADAVVISTKYSTVNKSMRLLDTSLGSGEYYYWVVAVNSSGSVGSSIGPATVTV